MGACSAAARFARWRFRATGSERAVEMALQLLGARVKLGNRTARGNGIVLPVWWRLFAVRYSAEPQ
jgi:hypothetical protein